jgi:CCR4-NOT transcription complex subunit 7/8
MAKVEALAPDKGTQSGKEFHEVWDENFEEQFSALLSAVSIAGGSSSLCALDMEFPGFLCPDPQFAARADHYKALRYNIDKLWPIQVGIAVCSGDGRHQGVWNFNVRFDAEVDAHTKESIKFLKDAGLDFPRHRSNGVCPLTLGRRIASSILVGPHERTPCWLTFSGSYDWGYLLKLVTSGKTLPLLPGMFDQALQFYCPKRRELRDLLPRGSLEVLGRRHGVPRCGAAHTAGSDALLTLDLFVREQAARGKSNVDQIAYEKSWHNAEAWDNDWSIENAWLSHSLASSMPPVWNPSTFFPWIAL